MKKLILSLSIILSALVWGCSDDEPTKSVTFTDAESFFTDLDFQGTVIIKKGGSTLLSRGYGMANLATDASNTSETKFRLASVSKTLTAMGVIQLKRDGLIDSFDQTLSEFDEEFPYGNEISIRHLLTHQSGIRDYVGTIEPIAKSGTQVSPEDIFDALVVSMEEEGPLFSPGTSMSYSNSNFLIAAILIEELSDQSYEQYITENVLIPLGMNDTEIGSNEITEAGYAHGYSSSTDVSTYPMQVAFGAGNWTSTVGDMAIWCEAVMGNWFTAEEKSEIFPEDVPAESTMFGMGWFKSNIGGKDIIWHGGDIDGFSTIISFIPESEGVVVALSNQEDETGYVREQILETLFKHQF